MICYFNGLRLISSIKRILYFLSYVDNVRLHKFFAPLAFNNTGVNMNNESHISLIA